MKRMLLSLTALLAPLALAAGLNYSVVVNGQVAPKPAIVVNGETYVPLSALKLLGITTSLKGTTLTLGAQSAPSTAPGGANQRASLEGCVGEALFNGIWRLTVRAVKPVTRYNGQQSGYSLNLEWKNGSTKTVNPQNTGVRGLTLVLADGTILETETYQDLTLKTLPQAAGTTLDLPFYATTSQTAAGLTNAAKLLVEIDPRVIGSTSASQGLAYSTPTPSFRVNLDCRK